MNLSTALTTALIPLLPLAGFLFLGLFGKKMPGSSAGILGTLLLLVATVLSFYTAYGYFFDYGKVNGVYHDVIPLKYTWLQFSKELSIDMGILLDPISAMMIVVVCFVSLMVHIFSLSYLKGEKRLDTYYAFLGLFTFSMLGLVLSSNIFQLYIFWEGVGVSSFLLIGFYYDRPAAVAACKKAFIVTRFADLGFLIGILILSFYAGTLDFRQLIVRLTTLNSDELNMAAASGFLGISAITWGAILVFMGGAGKSAMFPLHIWLPDAMEGPTPVSALIHAATMVVAGVFLIARMFSIYVVSVPEAADLVAWVGAASAAIAAMIACTQTDIKRILAYSTMSQIGFMMFALGVSSYGSEGGLGFTASLFHLFTHAFFKALLFLCAGVIIHYVHSNEMQNMGGLRRSMPVTHLCFLIACLAIAGIPPFSGFFSKEDILFAAYNHNQPIYWIGLITSGLTAFYMFRLYFSVFWNRKMPEAHPESGVKKSEGNWLILLPLILLATGAAFAGFIPFGEFVTTDGIPMKSHVDLGFSILPVGIGIAGIALASWLYLKQSEKPAKLASSLRSLYSAAYHKFYIDEIYLFITRKILFNTIGRAAAWFDKNIVDGWVNLTGTATQAISERIKKFQSGKVQQYAIYFLGGVIGLAVLFIYLWK